MFYIGYTHWLAKVVHTGYWEKQSLPKLVHFSPFWAAGEVNV